MLSLAEAGYVGLKQTRGGEGEGEGAGAAVEDTSAAGLHDVKEP